MRSRRSSRTTRRRPATSRRRRSNSNRRLVSTQSYRAGGGVSFDETSVDGMVSALERENFVLEMMQDGSLAKEVSRLRKNEKQHMAREMYQQLEGQLPEDQRLDHSEKESLARVIQLADTVKGSSWTEEWLMARNVPMDTINKYRKQPVVKRLDRATRHARKAVVEHAQNRRKTLARRLHSRILKLVQERALSNEILLDVPRNLPHIAAFWRENGGPNARGQLVAWLEEFKSSVDDANLVLKKYDGER